jgi:SAM-dependent methyltransferase
VTAGPDPPAPGFAGFRAVDLAADPAAYVDYLDRVRALEAVAAWKERSFDLLEPRPGARLLEVGCGTGDDAVALAARVAPGGRVVGVDHSRTMLDEARRRHPGARAVEFVQSDVTRLDLPDGAFDGCRVERTLQHVERPDRAVAEMARVLRSGGRLVAAEPDWGTLVIAGPAPGTGRRVAAAAAAPIRSPDVGARLRGLAVGAGLVDVEVAARTMVLTDLAAAAVVLDLPAALARVRAEAPQAADAWAREAAEAEAAGAFLAAITGFMVCGRRG